MWNKKCALSSIILYTFPCWLSTSPKLSLVTGRWCFELNKPSSRSHWLSSPVSQLQMEADLVSFSSFPRQVPSKAQWHVDKSSLAWRVPSPSQYVWVLPLLSVHQAKLALFKLSVAPRQSYYGKPKVKKIKPQHCCIEPWCFKPSSTVLFVPWNVGGIVQIGLRWQQSDPWELCSSLYAQSIHSHDSS